MRISGRARLGPFVFVLLLLGMAMRTPIAAAQADPVGAPADFAPLEPSAESATKRTRAAASLRGSVSFTGLLVVPTQSLGATSGGFQVGAGLGWGWIPLQLGVDFGFSAAWPETFRSSLVDLPELSVDVERQDKLYFINAWLRLQPSSWPFVLPYVEGFAGTKLLQTEYTLSFSGGEGAISQTFDRDWTRSLGWGAGAEITFTRDSPHIFLNLGLRRLYSHAASFTQTTRSPAGESRTRVEVPLDSWLLSLGF
ncbi:MAG TPA: hypothetical protein VJU61_17810, partial [Polyangiaceae bacterium]|nr:hypothetical protein [Polyangiaceae bacterium]